MKITFDGIEYETDDTSQKDALARAIDTCAETWKLDQAITALRFKSFGNETVSGTVIAYMEKRRSQLETPQVTFTQGFVFRDDRKKCTVCTTPLELEKYGTGSDWFSSSDFNQFICGSCAMKQSSNIKTCSTTGCTRLFWACTSRTTCADCYSRQHYEGLAGDRVITMSQVKLDVPQYHGGVYAETLFRNFIKAQTNIDSICVSRNNGIDLVFITNGDDDYDLLTNCIGAAKTVHVSTSRYPSRDRKSRIEVKRGRVIHCVEVKVNDAQCSKAQKNAQEFVNDRIKRALKGEYGDDALAGAGEVERAMNKGAEFELHLIRVSMPRFGSDEYTQGAPVTAVRYPWGETRVTGGTEMTLLAQCNSITYMDSSWIGDIGERIAMQFLEQLGFDIRGPVQNNTGNGVDITAKLKHTPTSPRWAFFEVKASTAKFQTSLEHAEEEQWMFVMDRCSKAVMHIQNYKGLGAYQGTSVHPTVATVSDLFWDFQSPEHWETRALYFRVAVRLPNPGQNDAPQVKLLLWASPRSQGPKALKKDPIPQPLFIGYGGSSFPTPTSSVGKVSMQTFAQHPLGGRYDNAHSCFVMGCDCSLFVASSPFSKTCKTCLHDHGS
ncbi:hypothetical protein K8640_21060 [Myxococcus sp. XM-1-1-1]|uniref:hypothetical protein n=1 Tax=Myxococcus sp. XM-1-1-1 TaxID=2874602 RepID=UPI001CBAFA46|nr:hypothetical protein [Myxococcus sp. XM-1-1-1]MBZ4410707.1 hypothetical protein [Myxococcus sp. XM-1-1-1]